MKKVYIAHPYRGKPENFKVITEICQKLWSFDFMPVSSVHAFSFLDDSQPAQREVALKYCEELLKSCDEVWFFGDWRNSEGCRHEYLLAQLRLKPIRIIETDEDVTIPF